VHHFRVNAFLAEIFGQHGAQFGIVVNQQHINYDCTYNKTAGA
jgi:hypothetical protein